MGTLMTDAPIQAPIPTLLREMAGWKSGILGDLLFPLNYVIGEAGGVGAVGERDFGLAEGIHEQGVEVGTEDSHVFGKSRGLTLDSVFQFDAVRIGFGDGFEPHLDSLTIW